VAEWHFWAIIFSWLCHVSSYQKTFKLTKVADVIHKSSKKKSHLSPFFFHCIRFVLERGDGVNLAIPLSWNWNPSFIYTSVNARHSLSFYASFGVSCFTLLHGIDNYVLRRFNQMEPSISGRGAEPVYRDKIRGQNFSQLFVDVSVQCIWFVVFVCKEILNDAEFCRSTHFKGGILEIKTESRRKTQGIWYSALFL